MSGTLGAEKAAWRRRLRGAMGAMTAESRAAASVAVCGRVMGMRAWVGAKAVMVYASLGDEPDVGGVAEGAWRAGKRVALPRYREGEEGYEAAWVEAGWRGLRRGRFGVWEPGTEAGVAWWNQLDLVLVPGVGFSPDGCRLGRGRGYYDRLLTRVVGLKCGVAFDEQVVEVLPCGPLDIRLDCVVTPTCRWAAGRRVVVE